MNVVCFGQIAQQFAFVYYRFQLYRRRTVNKRIAEICFVFLHYAKMIIFFSTEQKTFLKLTIIDIIARGVRRWMSCNPLRRSVFLLNKVVYFSFSDIGQYILYKLFYTCNSITLFEKAELVQYSIFHKYGII